MHMDRHTKSPASSSLPSWSSVLAAALVALSALTLVLLYNLTALSQAQMEQTSVLKADLSKCAELLKGRERAGAMRGTSGTGEHSIAGDAQELAERSQRKATLIDKSSHTDAARTGTVSPPRQRDELPSRQTARKMGRLSNAGSEGVRREDQQLSLGEHSPPPPSPSPETGSGASSSTPWKYAPNPSSLSANARGIGPQIVIGVMTARHHFLQRRVLRETWVDYIHRHPALSRKVQVRFVIGEQACPIPTSYRSDVYGCEWSSGALQFVTDKPVIAYNVPKGTNGSHTFGGPLGMDFFTNYPIVVTHLGVFDSQSDGLKRNITASLYLVETNQLIARMNFTPADPGELIGGTRFKRLSAGLLLPKGYTFTIVAENYGAEEPCNNIGGAHGTQNDAGGLIQFRKVSRFGQHPLKLPANEEKERMESNQYAAGNFIYHADDTTREKSLSDPSHFARERAAIIDASRPAIAQENERLQEEQGKHGDLLLLCDHMDTYRSLPSKVLKFYHWVAETLPSAKFTMKIDDDCFLNMDLVLEALESEMRDFQGLERVWWSRFRTGWPTDKAGKWREAQYTSPVYPSFACGGGNMLSMDLVSWLARNRDVLHSYQGEDVSVGIWLAPLLPSIHHDNRWHVLPGHCAKNMFTMPELTPDELLTMWDNWTRCQDPCGCAVTRVERGSASDTCARESGASHPLGALLAADQCLV